MSTVVFHQTVKDVRLTKWLLAAWLLVLLAIYVQGIAVAGSAAPDQETLRRLMRLDELLAFVAIVAFAVIAAAVVQNDAPTSTTAFWLTRPVSGASMLASKLVLALLVLAVAPVLADAVAVALAAGWWPAAVRGQILFQLAWLLPLLAIAAVTNGVPQFLLVVVFEVVLWVGLFYVAAATTRVATPGIYDIRLIGGLVALLGAAVLALAYATRRARFAAAIVGASPLLVVAFMVLWPWQLHEIPPYTGAVSVSMDPTSIRTEDSAARHTLYLPLNVSGLPPGASTSLWHSYSDLTGGTEVWLRVGDKRKRLGFTTTVSPVLEETPADLERRAKARLFPDFESMRLLNPLWALPARVIRTSIAMEEFRAIPPDAAIEANVTLLVRKARLAAAVPIRAGATVDANSLRVSILRSEAAWGHVKIAVREAGPRASALLLEPFSPLDNGMDWGGHYLLRNRKAKEVVLGVPRSRGGFGPSHMGVHSILPVPSQLQVDWLDLEFDVSKSWDQPATEWLKDADLVLVTYRPLGVVSTRIEVRDPKTAGKPVGSAR